MTFSSAPPPIPAARPAFCDRCGAGLRPESRFCGGCGTPVVSAVGCPACGTSLSPDQRFCDQCGCDRATAGAPAGGLNAPPVSQSGQSALPVWRSGQSAPPAWQSGQSGQSAPPAWQSGQSLAAPSRPEGWQRVSIGNGRYRIEQFLGEGAMKQVYRAHDEQLDRDVAVSVISLAGLDETGLLRARREAQAMARLGANRHIVTVFDIGEERNDLYVISEFMTGGELAGQLDVAPGRRLPIAEVVGVGSQLADALDFVHERGIVHRDVKPQNIWIAADGTAKLGDFGLAVDRGRSRLTTNGMMIGTVAYMPPEQALGQAVDHRADLYSLGAVLYEMLTGSPPFVADDATSVISQHLSTPVTSPRTRRGDIPVQLDQLVVRLLAKDPAERPQSGAEVKASLSAMAGALDAPVDGPRVSADRLTDMGFVGREGELDVLRGAIDDAVSSRGRIISVSGDDGVGKTRLVSEAASYAALRGARVVWGRCVDDPGAPAYWPWVQVVRSLVHERDDDSLMVDLGLGAVEIAGIVSDLRARLPNLAEPPEMEPEQARFRLFDSVCTFMLNAARREPTVIVLDDVHVADPSSLRLLEFLAGHVGAARICVVVTAKEGDLGDTHPLSTTLTLLARERSFERIRLSGLELADVEALFDQSAGPSSGGRSERALVEAVFAESEGNPFFASEIIRHLLASGRVQRGDDGRWTTDVAELREVGTPEGIRDAILRRVDVLGVECREMLELASVFGRTFDVASLSIVAQSDEGHVRTLLEEAVASAVLVEGDEPGWFRFEHAAIRDTLYEQLPVRRRAELHRLAGEVIEELREDVIEQHLGELAHHFVQAARGGEAGDENSAKAADYAWWAGERAVAKHAYEEAATRFEQALSLLPESTEVAPRTCELLLALGDAQWRMGELNQARATFLDAAKLARRASLEDAFGRAALGYGGGVGGAGVVDRVDETLVKLLREGLAKLSERDSLLRVRLQGRLVVELVLLMTSTREERVALADDTIKMADRIGEPRHRLIALYSRQWADAGADDLPGQLSRADEILRLAMAVEDREMQFRARHFRYQTLLQLGDLASAERELAHFDQLVEELRQPYYEWQASVFRAGWLLKEGDLSAAERKMNETLELGRRNNEELALNYYESQLFMLMWARDGFESLVDAVTARAQVLDQSAWLSAAALIYAESGRLEDAEAQLRAIADDGFAPVRNDRNWLTAMTVLCHVVALVGDAEIAKALYERVLPYADQHTTVLAGAGHLGSNHFFVGMAARAAGRVDEAIDHFASARKANERARERLLTPQLCCELARSLIERGLPGDLERAHAEIEHGLAIAQSRGMKRHVEKLLKLRLDAEGVGPITNEGSIFVVARSVRSDRPDLTRAAAPDGTVTIMFSDIQDSTVLTDRLGDNRWMELLGDHNAIVTSAVDSHGGYEVKAQGDGYMIAFDSGRRALKCAVDIQRNLARYRAAHPESPLHVRIGLHTGEVIRDQDDFFGRNVILAARVASSAAGDEILASSVVRELTISSGEVEFGEFREVELKGLSGLHRVYAVPY